MAAFAQLLNFNSTRFISLGSSLYASSFEVTTASADLDHHHSTGVAIDTEFIIYLMSLVSSFFSFYFRDAGKFLTDASKGRWQTELVWKIRMCTGTKQSIFTESKMELSIER